MKGFNYIFLGGAIILFFVGLYFWLNKGQIDDAVFYFALAAISQSSCLMATNADKAANKQIST